MLQSGLQSADSFGQETTHNRSGNMSIEVTLKELTEALKANTAALLSAGGSTGGAAAEEGKPAKPAAGKTTKPAAGKTTKPAAKPAAEEGEGEVDLDKVKEVFGGFLKIDDEKKRALRKKFAGTLLEQYGVTKASDLDPQDYAEAVGFIERALAGEKVDPSTAGARLKAGGADEQEEEEEDDGMV